MVLPLVVLMMMSPSASALEDFLNAPDANFQNAFRCGGPIETIAPTSIDGVQAAVQRADSIQSKGAGHSWNRLCMPHSNVTKRFYFGDHFRVLVSYLLM